MPSERCETCRFVQIMDESAGRCRRHAPRPIQNGAGEPHDPEWPVIYPSEDWCGEYAMSEAERKRLADLEDCPF